MSKFSEVVLLFSAVIGVSVPQLAFAESKTIHVNGQSEYTSSVQPSNTYKYSLNAKDENSQPVSAQTTVITLPANPTNVKAAVTNNQAVVDWDKQGESTYSLSRNHVEIYRGMDASYIDQALSPGTYQYSILAINPVGIKSKSVSVPAVVSYVQTDMNASPPAQPSHNRGSGGGAAAVDGTNPISAYKGNLVLSQQTDQINISWDKVDAAEQYILNRDGEIIFQGVQLNYADKDSLAAGMTHEYELFALFPNGSAQLLKTTRITIPDNDSLLPKGDDSAANTNVAGAAFSDIDDVFNKDEIIALTKEGIIQGATVTEFQPQRPITRAEFTALVMRSGGFSITNRYDGRFTDVQSTDWFLPEVTAAYTNKVVNGLTDDTFGPLQFINREQASHMISKVMHLHDQIHDAAAAHFTDQDLISDWAKQDIDDLTSNHMLNGYEDGSFRPQNILSRAEAAALIYRLKHSMGI
jgi:hypothetical protein